MGKVKHIALEMLFIFILSISNTFGQDNGTKPEDQEKGVMINGIKWATRNIDKPGTFAAKPENTGMFYQWNRKIGWSATDPLKGSNGSTTWSSGVPAGNTWEKDNDPSPAGWRIPTLDEIKTLLDAKKVRNEWITLDGVQGIKFTCKTSGNSIFLPVAGARGFSSGAISNAKTGCYWSSTPYGSYEAHSFYFGDGNAARLNGYRSGGRLVRCIAE